MTFRMIRCYPIFLLGAVFALAYPDKLSAQSRPPEPRPLVLGRAKQRFRIGELLARDDFKTLDNWVVQIQPKDAKPDPYVKVKDGILDCFLPGRGCTVWYKRKFKTRLTIIYQVYCPIPRGLPAKLIEPRDINNFWLATDPQDPERGLFDPQRYNGDFGTYSKMFAYYASTGGGRNRTTRMRRYPRVVNGRNAPHIALKDCDGKKEYLITPEKWMTIQLVAYDDLIQYIVDGKLNYEMAYGDQVPVETRLENKETRIRQAVYTAEKFPFYREGYFGFRMVCTHHRYRAFRVYRLDPVSP